MNFASEEGIIIIDPQIFFFIYTSHENRVHLQKIENLKKGKKYDRTFR